MCSRNLGSCNCTFNPLCCLKLFHFLFQSIAVQNIDITGYRSIDIIFCLFSRVIVSRQNCKINISCISFLHICIQDNIYSNPDNNRTHHCYKRCAQDSSYQIRNIQSNIARILSVSFFTHSVPPTLPLPLNMPYSHILFSTPHKCIPRYKFQDYLHQHWK
ncbi:hypothetical protein [Blautia glucerasea]